VDQGLLHGAGADGAHQIPRPAQAASGSGPRPGPAASPRHACALWRFGGRHHPIGTRRLRPGAAAERRDRAPALP
jgi:hypothetical protein